MNGAHARATLGVLRTALVCLLLLVSAGILTAQESLRTAPADEAAAQLQPGWKSIDRATFDAYAAAASRGQIGQAAGGLKVATYRLKLEPDGSLTGDMLGRTSLTAGPALIALGKPSFSVIDVELDGEKAVGGTDTQGVSCLFCPRDDAELRFRCSQQGVRRGESVEFSIDWLTAVATRVELTLPAGHVVETQGLLKTGQGTDAEGSLTLTFEAGARTSSTIRVRRGSPPVAEPFGFDLRQTLSATPTKVLLQSVINVLTTSTAPTVAEVEIPPGFSLLRATLGGDERIPVERSPQNSGPLRIPLGDLAAGQRAELRLVMERPADWSKPLTVPRVAPRNGVLLREELALQIEHPLEVLEVAGPNYELVGLSVQTARSVERAREVWTYQATSRNAALTLTARTPPAEWSADCFVKRRQQGSRTETVTLIDLRSQRSPVFEFDVDIVKPWKIVSITAPDAVGNPVPVSYQQLEESDRTVRHRVLLRTPATAQKGTTVTIAAAAQSAVSATSPPEPIAIPHGGRVENFLVLNSIEEQSHPAEFGPPIEVSALRSGLRTNSFFEPVRQGASTIRRLAGSKALDRLEATSGPPPAPRESDAAPTPPLALKDATSVAELRTLIGTATSPSSHRALFVYDEPVDLSGAAVRFPGDWTLTEVVCDGAPVNAVAIDGELRFPTVPRGVREILIRYSTRTASGGVLRRDRIAWPQLASKVQSWTWRVESPGERRVTDIEAPSQFANGVLRPGLRERLLAPLGRGTGVPIFNPFRGESWQEFLNPLQTPRAEGHSPLEFVAAVGRDFPQTTSIVSWSAPLLVGLSWVLFMGGMLVVVVLRRFRRGTFRFAATLSAVAATSAWLLPSPFGSMAGAVLCGSLLAYFIPRRLLSLQTARPPRASTTAVGRLAGATVLLVAGVVSSSLWGMLQTQSQPPNVLLLERDGEPAPVVYVSEAVARDVAAWQRERLGPPFLVRNAKYEVSVDDTDLATANLEFDLVVPRPDLVRTVQLPFEGLTFRGPDAARINGEVARLVPTADGAGILLALPEPPAENLGEPGSCRVQLAAAVRIPAGNLRREFSITIPRCNSAVGIVRTSGQALNDFRSSSRGRTQIESGAATCALGATAKWQARWWTGEVPDRPASDSGVTARAESVVTAEPQVLLIQTRMTFETPEFADPFASTRLEVMLPKGSLVASATGQTLLGWRSKPEPDAVRLLLDFSSPPVVGQTVDLAYELPIEPAPVIEIPPIPLLPPSRLSNHQVAIVTSPGYQPELLTKPNPDAGLWALEPSEASFSLRRDRGIQVPGAAIELESPLPIEMTLTRRATGQIAELEQSLSSSGDSIAWTGAARIETSVRPGFLYEFRVDPAIEITAANVVERDVERLSRFVREGERLLLVVGDDRLGTKNVRLEGRLRLEAGKVRPVPLFDLMQTTITRREVVVTSSSDQLLQVRRNVGTSLLVGPSDAEWEPQSPSSRRVSLSTTVADYEMRWINPASPLKLVEFLTLPVDQSHECSIEWRLESSQQLPATLAVDAPHDARIEENSDFAEEIRRPLTGDRVRIELQSKSSGLQEARIFLTTPLQANGSENGVLPRLADVSVQPVTYLAVPQSLLARYDIPGDFLNQLPAHAPAGWREPFHTRELLVFTLTGNDWRIASDSHGAIGDASAEVLASGAADSVDGETRLIISPSRAGVLKINAVPGGTLHTVRGSAGAFLTQAGPGAWTLLLRPSQPVAIIAVWTMPQASSTVVPGLGIDTPGLNIEIACRAAVPAAGERAWTPEILNPRRGADILASARLESLLAAARKLPIGVRPPAWLRDELLDLARTYRGSPTVGPLAVQVEGVLDSWSARMSTMTSPASIAPDSSRVMHSPEQLLAAQMLVAAADPELILDTPPGATPWSIPRRVFNAAFAAAWVIFWAFVIIKGGQWVARNQLADRLARHPGLLLIAIGLAWWLLMSPSAFGLPLALAGILWEVALVSLRRQSAPPVAGEAS